ncbi:hypothetical protein ACO0R3_003383 [Hanseniaspora guilliermondii]
MSHKHRILRKTTSLSGHLNTMRNNRKKAIKVNQHESFLSNLSHESISSKAEESINASNSSSDMLKSITPISSPSKRKLKNISRLGNDNQREISLVSDDETETKDQEEKKLDMKQEILRDFTNVSKKRLERDQNTKRTNLVTLDEKTDVISNNGIRTIIKTQKIKLIKDTKMFYGKPVLLLTKDDNSRLNIAYTESLIFINTNMLNFDPINVTNISQILVMNTYETLTFIFNKEIRGTYTKEEVEKRKQKEESLPSNNIEKFKYVTIKVNSSDSSQLTQFINNIRSTYSQKNDYFVKILDHDQYMERTSSFLKKMTKSLLHSTHQGSEYGILPPKKSLSNKISSKTSDGGVKISSPSSNMNVSSSSVNSSFNNESLTGYKPLGEVLKDGLATNSFYGKSSRTRSLSDRNPNTESETTKRSKYFEEQLSRPIKRRKLEDIGPSRRTRSQTQKSKRVEYAEIYDYEDIDLDYKRSTKRELNADLKHNFLDGTSSKIHDTDFKCLNSGEWLNGTIIDFFNKYYREEILKDQIDEQENTKEENKTYDLDSLPEEIKKQFYVFNSYFFLSLNNTEKVVNSKWLIKNNCSVMRDYKYHIIPINLNHHWFGCILDNFYGACMKTKQIIEQFNGNSLENTTEENDNVYSKRTLRTRSSSRISSKEEIPEKSNFAPETPKLKNSSLPKIQIYVFDSLRNTHKKELSNIQQFLSVFAKKNFGIDLVPAQFKMKNCQVIQQPNMNDCGVHLISNIRAFLTDTEKTLQYWNNSKFIADDQNLINFFKAKYKETSRHNLKMIIRDLIQRGEAGNDPYNLVLKPLEVSLCGSESGETHEDDEDLMIIDEPDLKKESNEEMVEDTPIEEDKLINVNVNQKENNTESNDNNDKKSQVLNSLENDSLFQEPNESPKKPNQVAVVTKQQNRISADISGKLQSHKKKSDIFVKKILDTDKDIEDEVFSESKSHNSLSKRHVSRTSKKKKLIPQ